jgi:predicted metalloendopeptidase
MSKTNKGGRKDWGFDIKNIDTTVRPQDDFYSYANGGWLKTAKIPAEESRWGAFVTLRFENEQKLKKLVETTRNPLVRNVYLSAMDMPRRNKLGSKPLEPLRKAVRAARTMPELMDIVARHHVVGISGMFGSMIDQDAKNSEKYRLHLWQGGLGMPERDYYLLDQPEQKRVRDAYVKHIEKLLMLAGASKNEAKQAREVVMRIETKLAEASMRKEDTRDSEKTYHKFSTKQLQKLCPRINWPRYFALTDAKGLDTVIVAQPDFFKALSTMLGEISIEEWKVYTEWHLTNSLASILSETFIKENFWFYSTVLTGTKKMRPLWRRALGAVGGTVGYELGKEYVKTHFPPAAKRAMDQLVTDLFDVYEDRMRKLDWMSPATKKKAIVKLRAMTRKIGYPTKWKGYKGLVLKKDDYFGNMLRSSEYEHKREMKKLRSPLDRAEWHMTPQTVNAYCHFNMNEIVFPAGILQWPFFDLSADAAINYAGIGTVIGHEMTHAFDDQGAKFDHKGNMKSWWSEQDKKKFEHKGALIKQQYDSYEVADGITVNGQLTLGENIADLGGLVIGWDAYQRYLARNGRMDINGLSPEQRFFFGFAQMERELIRPEAQKMYALNDPHAPAFTRINGPLANFEPFYKLFGVKKTDKLYKDPKKRAKIW